MITLASDFGSPYPAAMKGVLCSHTDAQLVDIAHDLPRHDVRAAAFWLRETIPFFPPAVHLAVVDPGVGTDRRAIALRVGSHALVGPDNGLLRPVARRLAVDGNEPVVAFRIRTDDSASTTFHGRDVFAPAAAAIHEAGVERIAAIEPTDAVVGIDPLSLDDCVDLSFPEPTLTTDRAVGEVLVVDDFGNAVTNVPGEWLARHEADTICVNGDRIVVADTFADVAPGERVVIIGSHGYVECDVNRGRGDDAFGLAATSAVRFVRE